MKLHFLELLKMVIAYALAFPIGWERERDERTAGIRTFPLVCMASCAYVLVGTIYFQSADANARVIQGLLSGVGFIGAGAIIQDRFRVHGTATAAAILGVGAIGSAVAYGAYDIGIVIVIVTYLTLRFLKPKGPPPPTAKKTH